MSAPATAVRPAANSTRPLSVAIVGAGFGGIAAAIEFSATASTTSRSSSRRRGLGGTWFYNSYPGAACDVPSHLYSFSFAQRRDWSRLCSPQAEIHDYLREVARTHGVERHIDLQPRGHRVRVGRALGAWRSPSPTARTTRPTRWCSPPGSCTSPPTRGSRAPSVRRAQLSLRPLGPRLSLAGKRVAVVGTGASAVQFVPEIAQRPRG